MKKIGVLDQMHEPAEITLPPRQSA
jgi:hypothetical protein